MRGVVLDIEKLCTNNITLLFLVFKVFLPLNTVATKRLSQQLHLNPNVTLSISLEDYLHKKLISLNSRPSNFNA